MIYVNKNDFLVENILIRDAINILQLFDSVEDKSFYIYAVRRNITSKKHKNGLATRMEFAISGIMDERLKKTIVEFLVSELRTSGKLSPLSYWDFRLVPLDALLMYHKELMRLPYEDFKNKLCGLSFISKEEKLYYAIKTFCKSFVSYCYYADSVEDKFNRDIWLLDEYPISSNRFNKTAAAKTIRFDRIADQKNKYMVKKYIEYRIYETNITVNNLITQAGILSSMLNMIGKPYDEWNSDDAELYITELQSIYPKKETLQRNFSILESFTSYLLGKDYLLDSPIKRYHELKRIGHTYQYKATAPDEYVVAQLFGCLDKIEDKRIVLYFLLIYCTGMRGSEAVSLEKDCLELQENGAYIRYYSIKMKKYVTNIIPKALYDMLMEYIKTIPESKQYLFYSSKHNVPLNYNMFSSKVRDEFKKYGIKNSDGTNYCFKSHSFRHLMGVRMREHKIPFQFIQEQLHHESPEMTLAYVEYLDKQKIQKMEKYEESVHQIAPRDISNQEDVENAYAECVRENINSQLLPNGLCGRPAQLGRCNHANNCLFCPNFRTDKRFLEVHKEQARKADKYIELAEAKGWLPQVETQKKLKHILDEIICCIEKGEKYYGKSNTK